MVNDMKVLKKANQKNVIVNKYYYNELDIKYMLIHSDIFYYDENIDNCYDYNDYDFEYQIYRIFTDDIKELKVVCDEEGFYTNVAILKNGKSIFVEL